MSRKTWIQHPLTGKLVPKEDYVSGRSGGNGGREHLIQNDIEPFVSPIDGSHITSRSHLRTHNAKHGVTDSRDYSHDFMLRRSAKRVAEMTGQTSAAKRERRELIKREIAKYER